MLTGLIWFLQGIGVLQGSWMSNQAQWVLIGLLTAGVGAGAFVIGRRTTGRGQGS
ncbi:MAG: hypothetical protein U0521_07100 [Anaerolineae bacterium]